MEIELNTKLELPDPIQSGPHKSLPIDGKCGLCASFFSPDKLDEQAFAYAKLLQEQAQVNNINYHAMDLGCSKYFPQSIRFASLGLSVDAFDIAEPIPEYAEINAELKQHINFIQADLSRADKLILPNDDYQLVYSNRFISHIPFLAAKSLFDKIYQHCQVGCRFFLSFGTLNSAEADGYPDLNKLIEDRFSVQSSFLAEQHQLRNPVCLYQMSDIEKKFLANCNVKRIADFQGTASIKVIYSKI